MEYIVRCVLYIRGIKRFTQNRRERDECMKNEKEIKVKSLQKALEVLNCFIDKQPLGVTEISEQLGLYKSNVHNILVTFKSMGYLEQELESGKYRLGTAIFSLSRALKENMTVSNIVLPFLQRIAEEVNEVVYLSIPKDNELIYLDVVYPIRQFYLTGGPVTGERADLYCTGAGKAILARYPDEEVERILSSELKAYTEYTVTDKSVLWQEIRLIRKKGYAIDNMETILGVKCIGVAIQNHAGEVECGISVSAPSLRMGEEKIIEFAAILKRYKHEIEKML